MKRLIFGLAAIAPTAAPQQPPPATEVYLADLGAPADPKFDGALLNISNNPYYDNQPSFTPDGRAILFTSVRGGAAAKSDIYRYDIASKALTQLTHTEEAEYSPLVTPDGKTFSVIRVEADNTQRLWRFDLDGTNPRLVLENIKPVGYQAWIDATHLGLFVLGAQREPSTLQLADVTTGKAEIIDSNIGRGLAIRPNTATLTYVSKATTPWTLQGVGADRKPQIIGPLTAGPGGPNVEDYSWDPSFARGRIFLGAGAKLWAYNPFLRDAEQWEMIADFSSSSVGKISRLAASLSGGHLRIAFVAEPVAK